MSFSICIVLIVVFAACLLLALARIKSRIRANNLLKLRQKELVNLIDKILSRSETEFAKTFYQAKLLAENADDEDQVPAMRVFLGSALLSCESSETKQALFETWRKLLVAELIAKKTSNATKPARIIKKDA